MTARVISGIAGIEEVLGQHLGYGDPVLVDQARIDMFADATGDHQWIHTDPVQAAAGPFGTTIAHGQLTVSMGAALVSSLYAIEGVTMMVNKGTNKVRFLAPVLVDSEIYGGVTFDSIKPIEGGADVVLKIDIKIKGSDELACVAEYVVRVFAD